MKTTRPLLYVLVTCFLALQAFGAEPQQFDYRVLATSKTSTMEKELNEGGDAGYLFSSVMGGQTAFGGKEVVVVMVKSSDTTTKNRHYKLLATSKTSTLQKELQSAGDEGFEYRGQTIFESAFGGKEVSVILEQANGTDQKRIEYKVLATSKTSTTQKELQQAGEAGFKLLGMMVGKTAIGGAEIVSILSKHTN